jgi:hypothetical protein
MRGPKGGDRLWFQTALHGLLVAPSSVNGQQDVEIFHHTIKLLGGIGFPNLKGEGTWGNKLVITPR